MVNHLLNLYLIQFIKNTGGNNLSHKNISLSFRNQIFWRLKTKKNKMCIYLKARATLMKSTAILRPDLS